MPERADGRQRRNRARRVLASAPLAVFLGAGLALLSACTKAPTITEPPEPESRVPAAERPFLLDPASGYPLAADPAALDRIATAFASLATGADLAAVRAEAEAVLLADPELLPAIVLAAQVDFLQFQDRRVVDALRPVVDTISGTGSGTGSDAGSEYVAASLLLARSLERSGAEVLAYGRYRALADQSAIAAERADELHERAHQVVQSRFDEALRRGRAEMAREELDRLRAWSPDTFETLDAERRLWHATGDEPEELVVVRRLIELDPSFELRHRQAELELSTGEVRTGLDLYSRLIDEMPDDPSLEDGLARAKFLYKLLLLPPRVQELARAAELDRADLATMLYWLFPSVRYSEVDAPPIAQDILDEPGRDEILRVLDLDLMGVDRALHRFRPLEPATRQVALAALLSLMLDVERPPACLSGEPRLPAADRSRQWVCWKASQCGLIAGESDCLPAARLAGAESVDLVRRALGPMGEER